MASNFEKVINLKIQGKEGIEELSINLDRSVKSIDDLESHLGDLNKGLKNVEVGSKEFAILSTEIQKTKGKLSDADKQLESFSSVQRVEAFKKLGEGIFGAFELIKTAELGGSSEDLQKVEVELQKILVVSDGLKKVTESLSSENLKYIKSLTGIDKAFKASANGAKIFGISAKAAIAATGIGLLLVALVSIVEYWDDITASTKKAGEAFAGVKNTVLPALKLIGQTIYDNFITPFKTGLALAKETASFFKGEGFNFKNILKPAQEAFNNLKDNINAVGDAYTEGVKKKILADNLEILKSHAELSKSIREQNLRVIEDDIANGNKELEEKKKLYLQKKQLLIANANEEAEIIDKTIELNGKATTEQINQKRKLATDIVLINRNYLKDIEALEKADAEKKKENNEKEIEDELDRVQKLLEAETEARNELRKLADDDLIAEQAEAQTIAQNELTDAVNDTNAAYEDRVEIVESSSARIIDSIQKEAQVRKDIAEKAYQAELKLINDSTDDEFFKEDQKRLALEKFSREKEQIEKDASTKTIKLSKDTAQAVDKIDEEAQAKINARKEKAVAIVTGTLQAISSVVSAIGDLQAEADQKKIDDLAAQAEEKKSALDLISQQAEESNQRIDELEQNLNEARGERFQELRAQLENERKNRNKLRDEQKKLEKEKIQAEKKQVEAEKEAAKKRKQIALIEAGINLAQSVLAAMTVPPPLSFIAAAAAAVLGAVQVAKISSSEFAQGGLVEGSDGGLLLGPTHANGGIPAIVGGSNVVSLEGDEAIINKRSTAMFRPILSQINQAGGGVAFADGGIAQTANLSSFSSILSNDPLTQELRQIRLEQQLANEKPIYVSVQEVNSVNNRVKATETRARF